MRSKEFLLEKTSDPAVAQLKNKVVQQVKNTNDPDLLDKIYTVLNKSGLTGRISGVLERDTDTKGYIQDITDIIIRTPGTYEEKHAFIEGFPNGYVDIEKMLSGNRVTFKELITGGDFVRRVFVALKRFGAETSKGPGEFALAVMSPHIKINGKSDLKINGIDIELKASAGKEVSSGGGRLGEGNLLDPSHVAKDISSILKIDLAKALPEGALGLTGLIKLCQGATNATKTKLGNALFGHIFKNSVPVNGLTSALVAGDQEQLRAEYIRANYKLYQDKTKFHSFMLMNFALGEMKYYKDVEQIINDTYSIAVYLISSDAEKAGRQILAQVTLAPFREPKVVPPDAPGVGDVKQSKKSVMALQQEFHDKVIDFCQYWARNRGITDPEAVDQMVQIYLTASERGTTSKSIVARLSKMFPKQTPDEPEEEI